MTYAPFTFKAARELASPPTWVAAIMPCLVGGAAAFTLAEQGALGLLTVRALLAWLFVLITAILLQSAANTLNDYVDFLAGTDTAEAILDPTDAALVYNNINPRAARTFAIVLILLALVSGLAAVVCSGWILLLLGGLAALIVVCYSVGPKPISYLPLGEAVSGVTMGLFITLAAFFAVTLSFDWWMLAVAVPPVVTIALIMQTNNTCDIERDIVAGRRTLPILLTRARSQSVATALAWGTLGWMCALSLAFWPLGVPICLAACVGLRGHLRRIASGPYDLVNRRIMMRNITAFCRWVNLAWTLAILSGLLIGGLL
jgi:1,4-dihydroxy-2-naphthoate octaprenyltransferase